MKHVMSRLAGAAVLAVLLGIASVTPLRAQNEIPDAKLESFVMAAMSVQDLIEEWSPRIQAAEDEAEAAAMREQANVDLAEAIEQTEGMSVEEYQEIGRQAQQDPDLNARIQEIYRAQIE